MIGLSLLQTVRYLGRLRHIPVGARHRHRKVHLLVAGAEVRIVTTDGVLLRALTLDPACDYQSLGTGRWPVHNVLRQALNYVLRQGMAGEVGFEPTIA